MSRNVPTSNVNQPCYRRVSALKTEKSNVSSIVLNRQLKYRAERRESEVITTAKI